MNEEEYWAIFDDEDPKLNFEGNEEDTREYDQQGCSQPTESVLALILLFLFVLLFKAIGLF